MDAMTPEKRAVVADACGIGSDYLYQVLTRRRLASPALCVLIERATKGNVTRKDLREDWADIWPELKKKAA